MFIATHQLTQRVVDILKLLADYPEDLTLTEIAHRIGSPKSTVLPIVHTIAQRKFIFLNKKTRSYTIGLGTYCVGASYNIGKTAVQFIKNEMNDIVGKTGEICQMRIFDKGQVLYFAKVDSFPI
jgi:DNA-binding IclR family transcriptional regulator